jgi:hypothetical protein
MCVRAHTDTHSHLNILGHLKSLGVRVRMDTFHKFVHGLLGGNKLRLGYQRSG